MGIPRLTAHLEPYFESNVIGCLGKCGKTSTHKHRSLTIDGPALAYFLYHALLSKSGAASAIDALPSYELLGGIATTFLDGLQRYDVDIESIYFDGYLPESKRSVRLARLESYRRQLSNYHSRHLTGAIVRKGTSSSTHTPIGFNSLLDDSTPTAQDCKIPAAPFLVPAIIEDLRRSPYSPLVKLVPGEADIFCAHDAKVKGCLVLTGDSDLLVHDLGEDGAVTFFDRLQMARCDGCCKEAIISKCCEPQRVCSRLGVNSLLAVGYEIKTDYTIQLAEAVRRARQASTTDRDEDFSEFAEEYKALSGDLTDLGSPSTQGMNWDYEAQLDPRVSEIVTQALKKPESATLHVYLPFLIEDPTRASAWAVAEELRVLAYSLVTADRSQDLEPVIVAEYYRRGPAISASEIHLLKEIPGPDRLVEFSILIENLREYFRRGSDLLAWRMFAMAMVLKWYKETGRTRPTNEAIARTLKNSIKEDEHMTWSDIHFIAQLEAALYSFRMLKQLLDHFKPVAPGLRQLSKVLAQMPHLVHLMLPRSVSDADEPRLHILNFCDLAGTGLYEDPPASTQMQNGPEAETEATAAASELNHVRKKRKKTQKKQELKPQPSETETTNNPYSVLPPS